MRILGVDPALTVTGYGLIEQDKPFKFKLVEAGVIRTSSSDSIDKRLLILHNSLRMIIQEFCPQVLVLEKIYSHVKHPTTSILMGHARGTICLLCGQNNINLVSISATRIKKTIVGNGHASKVQVQRMIEGIFGLQNKNYPLDVTDALALAVGYLNLNPKLNMLTLGAKL